ncbi:FtsW/RodA/SpoVE family cell cycle protein [Haloglycomyces albus]|uniref:FtsW/RodA/SpoVE family cell cycle protein n=1 Tax=Haloglycomyces albus TaxID=526067 RepID=UPI00046C9D71|nr:FtsW/RodA/SpoVE family cell cycle protein [Haloglycomyces albus]
MSQSFSAVATASEPSEPTTVPKSGMPRDDALALGMIVVAGLALVCLQASIEQAVADTLTLNTLFIPGAVTITGFAAWAATKKWAPYADPIYVALATIFSGVGIIFIRRLALTRAEEPLAIDANMFADTGGRQLIYSFIGVLAFAIILGVLKDHRDLRKFAYIIAAVSLIGIILPPLLPASISEAGGAKLWLRLGPISIQPSEFANIGLIVFFAHYLISKRDVLTVAGRRFLGFQFPRLQDLVPVIIVLVTSLFVLVFARSLGQSLMIFAVFLAMLYMATRRISWLFIGVLSFAAACVAVYPLFSHLQVRVRIFLDPYNPDYVNGQSYQLVKALDGLTEGGLLGAGPGQGKANSIPLAESDFMFPTLGYEIGLFALTALLLLYLIMVGRGFKTAMLVRDNFGKLLTAGLSFLIAFQVFVVIGGATALIPMTGATTPFLAAGGSSVLATWILIALLVRVSNEARKPHRGSNRLEKVTPPPEWLQQKENERQFEERRAAAQAEGESTQVVDLNQLRGRQHPSGDPSPPLHGGNAPPQPPPQSRPYGPGAQPRSEREDEA